MKKELKKFKQKIITYKYYKFELVFLGATILAIFFCMLPAIRTAGWPHGTDFDNKTQLYAKHIKEGDFIPIWSSDDAYGMGSPLPTFYHKTFYYISGTALVITNSVKLSILMSIGLFMLVGTYGMRFCLRKMTEHKIFIVLASQTILFANYTFTNWLVRDDMAEFAAMMIVPWLIWWCLKLLKEKKFSYSIAPIMFFLINAHNVIALFGLIPAAIAYLVFLMKEKLEGFYRTIKPALISVGILMVLLLPLLILEKLFLRYYDPSKITQAGYLASSNFHPFYDYLLHPHYIWLNASTDLTVQIDFGITIPLVIILLGLLIDLFSFSKLGHFTRKLKGKLGVFLLASMTIFILLQLKISGTLYEHLKFMQFLQFPWRLLTYITVLGIIFIAYATTRYNNKLFLNIFSIVWLGSFVLLSPVFKTVQHGYTTTRQFSYRAPVEQKTGTGSMMGIGEYLPRVYKDGAELKSLEVASLYGEKFNDDKETELIKGGPCTIQSPTNNMYESMSFTTIIRCDTKSLVALPISFNDFTTIQDIKSGERITYRRMDKEDPRIIITVPANKKLNLLVSLPTVPRIIKKLL